MNSLERQLKALVNLFFKLKIRYALLGGLAVSYYGEPRITMDTDIVILLPSQETDSFLRSVSALGFKPLSTKPISFIKQWGMIPLKYVKQYDVGLWDIIIAQSPLEEAAIKRARIKKINAMRVKLVSPEDLVIHKIISDRPRDIQDLEGILSRQKGNLDTKYISQWLKKVAQLEGKPDALELFRALYKR